VLSIVATATDGRTALAAGSGGTVLRSVDGGANWTAIASGTQTWLSGLAIARDGKTALVGGLGGVLLRSVDGGASWTAITSGTPAWLKGVALAADGRMGLAVGPAGAVVRSTDGGASWTAVTSGAQTPFGLAIAADARTALAVGGDLVLRSVDAGARWTAVTLRVPASLSRVAIAADGQNALAVGAQPMLRSIDRGASWTPILFDQHRFLYGVAIATDGRMALAVGSGGTVLRSVDSGASWTAVASGTQVWLTVVAIAPDSRTALAAGSGTVLRSVDGGASWTAVVSGTLVSLNGVAIAADGRTALVVGQGGTVLRSSDAGANWTAVSSGTQASLTGVAFAPDGETALAVGDAGTVLRSGDGGANWTALRSGTRSLLYGVAIAADGRTALVTRRGGAVLRSPDLGTTWERPPHQRKAPPLTWLLLAIGFVLAWPATRRLPPEPHRAEQDIASLLATDRPLTQADPDVGGTTELADRLSRFLRNRHTEPPLTLAIVGAWGSGKSSVCARLCDDLKAHGLRPVQFNAWHHQKEENIFAALLEAVRREAVPSVWSGAGFAVRLRLWGGRMRRKPVRWTAALVAICFVLGALMAVHWPTPLEAWQAIFRGTGQTGEVLLKNLQAAAAPIAVLVTALTVSAGLRDKLKSAGLDPGKLRAASAGALRFRDLGAQLAFRARFAEALAEVTRALGDRTLTIVIDDLDRCRPDQVAETMEAVNFLASSAGCFIVLAMAREHVLAALGQAYAVMAKETAPPDKTDEREIRQLYAENYLRKLIQIEVPVPAFDQDAAAKLMDAAARERERPRDTAWKGAALGVAAVLLAAAAFGGGNALVHALPSPAPASVSTPALPQEATGPGPVLPQPQPAPQPPSPAPAQAVAVEPGRVGEGPGWETLTAILAPFAALLVLAVVLQWRRRTPSLAEEDTPLFARALQHWAKAAFLARPSPREMKRFLNRLRLAATASGFPDAPTAVGLAAFAHADREVVTRFADGEALLLEKEAMTRAEADPSPWRELVVASGTVEQAGLPRFAPRARTRRASSGSGPKPACGPRTLAAGAKPGHEGRHEWRCSQPGAASRRPDRPAAAGRRGRGGRRFGGHERVRLARVSARQAAAARVRGGVAHRVGGGHGGSDLSADGPRIAAHDGVAGRHDAAGGADRHDPAGALSAPAAPLLCRAVPARARHPARAGPSGGTGRDRADRGR
jgi:photosystem II stability/assembly factor-like uncharacterized protein